MSECASRKGARTVSGTRNDPPIQVADRYRQALKGLLHCVCLTMWGTYVGLLMGRLHLVLFEVLVQAIYMFSVSFLLQRPGLHGLPG